MTPAYQALIDHLDNNHLRYKADEENNSCWFSTRCDVALYHIRATVEDGLFQVFGWFPINVPPGSRRDVAEAILRANYAMKVGKFEMDMNDGEVRFQAYSMFHEDELADDLIFRTFQVVVNMLDRYTPAFLSVIYGNEPPADAIKRVETPPASQSRDESNGDVMPDEDLPF